MNYRAPATIKVTYLSKPDGSIVYVTHVNGAALAAIRRGYDDTKYDLKIEPAPDFEQEQWQKWMTAQ